MNKNLKHVIFSHCCNSRMCLHRGADTSLARPGRKQTTETEDFDFHIYPVYNHNWRNISTIYIYNTTNIKRNILTIKKKIHREVGRAKDLSAPLYLHPLLDSAISSYAIFSRTQS